MKWIVLLLSAWSASAAIYPPAPTSTTTYYAGSDAEIAAVQLVMAANDILQIRKGTYTTGKLWKTGVTFKLDTGAVFTASPCIAVTNGTLVIDGDGLLEGTAKMTNGMIWVKSCALFAMNLGQETWSHSWDGFTNTVQIDWANTVAVELANTTNLMFRANCDIVANLGTVSALTDPVKVYAIIHCRRFGVANSSTILTIAEATTGVFIKVDCDIADCSNSFQIATPSTTGQKKFVLKANVHNIKPAEAILIMGGTSVINTYNQGDVYGYWFVNTDVTIQDEVTPFFSVLGL